MGMQVRWAEETDQWVRAVLALATEVQSQSSRDRRKELMSKSCLLSSLSCSHNKEIKCIKISARELVQESSQGSLAAFVTIMFLYEVVGRAAGPHMCLPFVKVDQVSQGKVYAGSPIEIWINNCHSVTAMLGVCGKGLKALFLIFSNQLFI